jgi:hypothetical protein
VSTGLELSAGVELSAGEQNRERMQYSPDAGPLSKTVTRTPNPASKFWHAAMNSTALFSLMASR